MEFIIILYFLEVFIYYYCRIDLCSETGDWRHFRLGYRSEYFKYRFITEVVCAFKI